MDISIVIPLLNECESLQELSLKIDSVMKENSFSYEVIYVDDGSNDNSWEIISSICKKNSSFKAIKFSKNYGKSQALHAGFEIATGNIVFTSHNKFSKHKKNYFLKQFLFPQIYKLVVKYFFLTTLLKVLLKILTFFLGGRKKDLTLYLQKTFHQKSLIFAQG